MNPETITTSQLFASFTAKHWALSISAILTIITATVATGYKIGLYLTEVRFTEQQTSLKLEYSQRQVKLEAEVAQLNLALKDATRIMEELEAKQQTIERNSNEIAKLTEDLDRCNNSNCVFIHQQIIDTKKEMATSGSVIVNAFDPEWNEREKLRKATLEQRLNGYQQQLGGCNKK